MVFTTGHEAVTYQKFDMRSCVYTKRYTNHKPTYKVQTQRQYHEHDCYCYSLGQPSGLMT